MTWTEYQPRFLQPAYIERSRDTPLALSVYSAGVISAPSSGTISVFTAANVAIVDEAAVTIAANQARYTVLTSVVGAEPLGPGWRVEWSLVMGDTNTHVFVQDGALVRNAIHPVVTDLDLTARHSDLNAFLPAGVTSWEAWILEAWREVVGRLEGMGRRPYLILSPEALRPVHQYTTLGLICRDLSGAGDPGNKWAALAEHYDGRARDAWGSLSLIYDEEQDGAGSAVRRRGMTSVWLAGRS
jgi:hypothetical protein